MKRDSRTVIIAATLALALIPLLVSGVQRFQEEKANREVDATAQAVLQDAIANVDRMEIYASDMFRLHHPKSRKNVGDLLLKLSGQNARDFSKKLELRKLGNGESTARCLCDGTHDIRFYRGKKLMTNFLLMEKGRLRSPETLWPDDRPLSQRSQKKLAIVLDAL